MGAERCPECGELVINRGAHAEACMGLGRCKVVRPTPGAFNAWERCTGQMGHAEGHIWPSEDVLRRE